MPKFSAYMRGEGVKGDTGKNATFGEVSATTHLSDFPSVTITTSGPEDQKDISFDFGLVSGPSGGFSTNQNANIQFTEVGSLPSVSITTDDASPNNSKVFNFDFKIPEPKNIVNIEQTILSTTSEGENEITISYNDNSSTTFIVHNGAQGTPSFIQGAVSTTLELPNNDNYTGQAFLVGDDEENKKLYVYLENEWVYQGSISGAGFGEPTGSIEIVSFTTSKIYMNDGVITLEKTEENNLEIESAKIYLQPVQDLHGYDSPWPAGGGVNLMSAPDSFDTTTNGVRLKYNGNGQYSLSGTNTSSAQTAIEVEIPSVTLPSSDIYIHLRNNYSTSDISLWFFNGTTQITGITFSTVNRISKLTALSGATVNKLRFTVPANYVISETITFQLSFELGSTATAWSPYSNVCPISGHATATVTRTGVNLLDPNQLATGRSEYYTVNNDKSITVLKQDGLAWNAITSIPLKAGTYTLSWVTQNSGQLRMRTSDNDYSEEIYINANLSHYTFTLTKDGGIKLKLGIIVTYPYTEYLQLEYGSTATAYAPYQGQTVTIDLNGERFGGTVDALTGVMTVDRVSKKYNELNWSYYGALTRFYSSDLASEILKPSANSEILAGLKSEVYEAKDVTHWGNYDYGMAVATNGDVYIKDIRYTTTDDLTDNIGNNRFVYLLATPITVQLTPAELSLLLGENNIWTDAGVLELDCSEISKPEIFVSVDPESPESAKIFNFDFKIPEGKPGEKGDTPIIGVSTSVTTLEHDVEPTVSITSLNENEFRFDFGIPVGYTPEMTATISTTDLPSDSIASATVNVEQNNLNFYFGIPQGLKGETGASINGFTFSTSNPETHGNIYYANFTDGTSTLFEVPEGPMGYGYYQKLPFTSTNIEESNQYTWIEESNGSSTLIINRTENDFIPVNIYNSTNNNIAATFTLAASTENYPFGSIQYNTNEKFDGILYYIGKAPVPQLRIGSVTTSGDGIASVSTNKDGYDTVLNFSFPIKGDKGDKGETGNGITSVEILSVQGLTTNYRITFTDETMAPFDFSVRNGRNGSGGEGGGGIDEVDLSDDSIVINTLPIEHGGTGAATSAQAWTNLGGGDSGKHPEGYYLTSTDVIIPTLDFTDTITSISTESYAGTSTYVARGDHVHSISLTTGDENGQVKIAGVNIDVKGLESAAYTVTTNYYPSTGGNIPTISIGGGERIDKISITNIDPGVGSELENNNILFVYTGGGGYSRCPDNSCYIITCPTNDCYNIRRYSESCPDDCYDSKCYEQCYISGNDIIARTMYNYIPVRDAEGHFYRYLSMDEQVTISGEFTYPDGQIVENPVICFSYAVGHEADAYLYYKIGENQYIPAFAVDTVWTCLSNCFNQSCPKDNCYNPPCYGTCWYDGDCGINECYDTGCPTDNCFIDKPCPGKVCDLSGCSRYVDCYTGYYVCQNDASCRGESFDCTGMREMNNDTCFDYCYEDGSESCGRF